MMRLVVALSITAPFGSCWAILSTPYIHKMSGSRSVGVVVHVTTNDEDFVSMREQDPGRSTTLCFRASKRFMSEPIPIPFHGDVSKMNVFMEKFFNMEETQSVLLAGTKSFVVKQSRDSMSLIQDQWNRECLRLHIDAPNILDISFALFRVQTSSMNFPGLKVFSILSIGSTYSHTGVFPNLQFVLIHTENKAEGLLQWIYNALIGKKNKDQGSDASQHSLTTVSISILDGGSNFVFTSDVMIEIGVRFPSILLKILPVTKEKAEEQGSTSVSNFIEKDVKASLDRLSQLYSKILESCD